MLIGARRAGFKVLGNIEWRTYYHEVDDRGRNTFQENFDNAPFPNSVETMTEEEFKRFSNPDLAIGHPECGNFSQLSGANKNRQEKLLDPADIPLFTKIISQLKPKFFVMDDLPKSFMAYPMQKYAEQLPEYDLWPEWISNWGYGNVQKGRKRMFMLGSLRDQKWAFRPGEAEHTATVADAIGDLPAPRRGSNYPNHDPSDQTLDCFRALNLGEYRRKSTWAEVQEYFRDKKGGHTLDYVRADGSKVKRIGFLKGHWDGPSHVLTGGNAILHHHRCEPYTIRERARIQGFPDDFVFYGTVMNDKGEWNHDLNQHMVRQTGKAMPIQFCEYVSKQIAAHLKKEPFSSTGRRVLDSNEFVDEAKKWYCQEVGYADQPKACGECWLKARCSIRTEKYKMEPIYSPTRPVAVRQVKEPREPRVAKEPRIAAPRPPKELPAAPKTKMLEF